MMTLSHSIRNIGILAHIDAGKTTITEHLLYRSGIIRSLGSVDKGTTYTDSLDIERQRGISVKAAEANLLWKDTEINILDTPGHIDFSAEVERVLRVLDGAVLVVSAVEGVQPQTEVYFKALKAMKIPTIIFINKVDRVGADTHRVNAEIKEILEIDTVELQILSGEGTQEPRVGDILNEADAGSREFDSLVEAAAYEDEVLLEKYLSGEQVNFETIKDNLIRLIQSCEIYPVFYGSAIKGIGIEELLDSIVELLPSPKGNPEEQLSGVIFKIEHHATSGKLVYVRLFSGRLQTREIVHNLNKEVDEKITQIRRLKGQREVDCQRVEAGEIAALSGMNKAGIGDILGSSYRVPNVPSISTPVLTLKVFPKIQGEFTKLLEALKELEEEDPLLNVEWIRDKDEIHIQIMGMMQLEVLQSILKDRFNLEASFEKPSVIYKETPSNKGIGFEAYTMPKPCWAVVKFEIEPLESGHGLIFESRVRTEKIKLNYQREVEKQLPITLKQGLYGWEVIDLKVTLVDGEDHVMHSNPGDFLIATAIGIMNGLQNTGTTLLEPIINFRISVPEETGGKVLGDLVQMRGEFQSPNISKGIFTVEGELPVATSLEYPIRLGILSGGKGMMTTSFSGYRPVPVELGRSRERTGVNPLDRAKYILYARNAIG